MSRPEDQNKLRRATLRVHWDPIALWTIALLAFLPWPAHGQTAAPVEERYARAAKLLWQPALAGVRNAQVIPHWIGRSDRFWYRRQTRNGAEFVIVDAATGTKTAAFDHAAVASSLSVLRKEPIVAEALPFGDIAFSEDGSTITFDIKASRYRCQILGGGCEALPQEIPVPGMTVSPDHRQAAFVRGGNLWLKDLRSGGERALTTDGSPDNGWGITPEPSDFHALARQRAGVQPAPYWANWSPDSAHLVVAHVDQSGVAPYPFMEYAPEDGSFRPIVRTVRLQLVGEKPPTVELWVFDVATGARGPLQIPSDAVRAPDDLAKASAWDKTGRHFFVFLRAGDLRSASLYDLDVVRGTTRVVFSEAGIAPALLSASGYGALSAAVIGGGAEFIWCSERDGWPHLYLYDLASGRVKNQITKGPWVVRNLVRIDERRRQIYFVGSGREGGNPYFRSLYRVDLDGRNLRRLTPETADKLLTNPQNAFDFDGAVGSDPVSPSGRYLAYTVSPLATPPSLVVRAADGSGPSTVVERADASALFAAGYKPPREFMAKAADGKSDIYGVIYRPSDYAPSKTYPILDLEYNSPIVVVTPRHFMQAAAFPFDDFNTPAAAAELGLIVVMMDARGTPFRGAAFSDPTPGYIASMGLDDHVAVIKALAARDPSMDMRHVGISGASFGAWTVIRALENYNSVFSVGVAWAPPGAFYNMYDANLLTSSSGIPRYDGGAILRPSPTARPDNWTSIDSIAQVGEMQGALLLGSGALDENVVPGSPLQFFEAATRADKHVEQVFLPNATHGPIAYLPYMVRRVWDFMVVNLRREVPPEDFHVPSAAPPAS